ncbi:MAG: C10 family peptidase, partial [Bacteroidales bacterium]|nr:C10 family peptidase [Candidatus Colimorpha onthohippi]
MKRLVCIFIFAVAFIALKAAPVDVSSARHVAVQYYISHGGNPEVAYGFVDESKALGSPNLFLFVGADGLGFVLVAADDCVRPIVGYSLRGAFEFPIKSSVAAWLSDYSIQIQSVVSAGQPTPEGVSALWKQLLRPSKSGDAYSMVGPLLQTTWGQSPLYNEQCPVRNGERCVTGCVATAMAQIMRYWSSPTVASGYHSYRHETLGTISATFGAFDWQNMPLSLSVSSSNQQVSAVARLMYHCGVSVDMGYNTSSAGGSSAYSSNVADALVDYFDYSSEIKYNSKSNFTSSQWDSILKIEIDAGRPVFYSGSGSGGGHAFVCDGYDSEGMFHFNWGWDGMYDGMFAIGALRPGSGGVGSNRDGRYDSYNAAITRIEPNYSALLVSPNPLTLSRWGGEAHIMVRSSNQSNDGWIASTSAEWLTLVNPTGMGGGSLADFKVVAPHNTTGAERSAVILFTQGDIQTSLRVVQPDGTVSEPGCYGNDVASRSASILRPDYAMIIRPECYGNFDSTRQVSKVCFETSDITYASPAAVGHRFVIEIYENCEFSNVVASGSCDPNVSDILGTMVYSQNFTSSGDGLHEVVLDVPYRISHKTFWVAVRCLDRTAVVIDESATSFTGAYLTSGLAATTMGTTIKVICPLMNDTYDGRYVLYFCTDAVDSPQPPAPPENDSCQTEYITSQVSLCYDYQWFDTVIESTGVYSHIIPDTTGNGCDSIFTLSFTKLVSYRDTFQYVSCSNTIEYYGIVYDNDTVVDSLFSSTIGGCDSLVTASLHILNSSDTTLDVVGCDSVVFAHSVFHNPGLQNGEVLHNQYGCDSIVKINVTILHSSSVTQRKDTVCDAVYFQGKRFSKDTIGAPIMYRNVYGCDSLVLLDLHVIHSTYAIDSVDACDFYVWNGVRYSQSVDWPIMDTIDRFGCDSIHSLVLSIRHKSYHYDTLHACDSVIWHNTVYHDSGSYEYPLEISNADGCDSIDNLTLILHSKSLRDTIVYSCDSLVWNGQVYYQSVTGNTQTYTDQHGCDSIVRLRLVVSYTSRSHEYAEACGYFRWQGHAVTEESLDSNREFFDTIQNQYGCDSVLVLHLTTYPQGTGALNGVFEVADGRRVSFSMGNLQYWPSNAMWRFAVRQYDFAGSANSGAAADY